MSVLAIGDLLFSDLLSELNIKPWWEKFRGYCFAASVASALFATYIILLSPAIVNCTPLITENVSSILEFSTTQAFLINTYCSNQIPWYVNYAGIIPLVCTILILAASICWLQIPEVIGAFRSFSETFENLKIPSIPTEKCGLWSEGSHEAGELSNNRKTCDEFLEYGSLIDVDQCYFIRNVVLLCITLLSAVASAVLSVFLVQDDNNFECSLDIKDERKIFGTTGIMRLHFCSYNTSKKLIPFMIFSSLSLTAQVFFILINIYKTRSNKSNVELDNLSVKASKAYRCCVLMINFWKNARPREYELFSNFIDFLFNRALLDMSGKVKHAILAQDAHMIRFYSSIKQNGGNDVIKVMKEMMMQKKKFDWDLHNNIVKGIGHLDSITLGKDTKNFIDYLFKEKYWWLFVHVLFVEVWNGLESFCEKKQFKTYIKNLNINTDELGEHGLFRPSILHFVLDEKLQYFQMTPQYKNPEYRKKFVHYNGKSKPISNVLNQHCISKIAKIKGKFPVKVFFECTDCSESKSLEAIIKLFGKHKSKTECLENQPDQEKYFKYQKEFAKTLSCIKFPEWNDHTKKLAKFLHSKKQWVVLVELLNAFIVLPAAHKPPVSSEIDFDCGVDNFTLTDPDADGASILYYALNIPIYFRGVCKEITNIKFHYTAIRYILKLTKKQGKVVIYPTINQQNENISAKDYVDDLPNICTSTKTELRRILEESTGRSPTPVPANQSHADDDVAGPSGSEISSPEVRPQASNNTTQEEEVEEEEKEEEGDDPQDSGSIESSHTKNDCPEDIGDNSQDSTSSKLSHTTDTYQEEKEDGPLLQ